MPAGKPSHSNAMLYTVITFVALFIISTSCGVIFYIKSEEYRTQASDISDQMDEFASMSEQNKISKTVGQPLKGESVLGTMILYLDDMVEAITGTKPEDTTAAVKVNEAKMKIKDVLEPMEGEISAASGPRGIDLLETISQLKAELDDMTFSARSIEGDLNTIQDDFDMAVKNFGELERKLIEEKNRYQIEADRIQESYDELKALMEQSTDEQIQTIMDKLERAEEKLLQKNTQLQSFQQELDDTKKELALALNKIEDIKPRPDADVRAFDPDARIVKVDIETNVVYLDVGSDDHVYRGLTFSVYDKNVPIPEDGKGKAEIEIFYVGKNVSGAQINFSSAKNPIVSEDTVVNLIWDAESSNNFVVAGAFDFDGDGQPERSGIDKVKQLVERWGGNLVDDVSVETDFVVIGIAPESLRKPSTTQLELDPEAGLRYDASVQASLDYDRVLRRARDLNVPVFNRKRFMHLIGFDSLARRTRPFSTPTGPAAQGPGSSY